MNLLDSEGMGKVKRAFDNYSKKMFSSNVIPTSLAQMLTLNKQLRIDVHKLTANPKCKIGTIFLLPFANIFIAEVETK